LYRFAFQDFVEFSEKIILPEGKSMGETSLRIDPEIESCVPPLRPEEFENLEANIIRDRWVSPIIVWKEHNIILDGHNRYKICQKNSIGFLTKHLSFPDKESAIVWCRRHALDQRNLTDYQRGELALLLREEISKDAKNRQKRKNSVMENSPQQIHYPLDETGTTRDRIAKIANLSSNTIEKIEAIAESGSEPLKELARTGKVSINAASKVSGLPEEQQVELTNAGPQAVKQAAAKMGKPQKAKPEPITKDKVGREIEHPQLQQIFTQSQENISPLLQKISQLKSEISAAIKNNPKLFQDSKSVSSAVEDHLDAAYKQLKSSVPYAVDPYCGGDGGIGGHCKGCKGLGWITKQQYDFVPQNHKRAAKQPEAQTA
jgi:ParB-like chromosome segregation protein Spo0J